MVFILTLCVFMSSSGESCDYVATYKTLDACIEEANRRKPSEGHNEIYKCEGRQR